MVLSDPTLIEAVSLCLDLGQHHQSKTRRWNSILRRSLGGRQVLQGQSTAVHHRRLQSHLETPTSTVISALQRLLRLSILATNLIQMVGLQLKTTNFIQGGSKQSNIMGAKYVQKIIDLPRTETNDHSLCETLLSSAPLSNSLVSISGP